MDEIATYIIKNHNISNANDYANIINIYAMISILHWFPKQSFGIQI